MYDLKMLEEIKSQEERIHFSSFDYNDAYTLGTMLRERGLTMNRGTFCRRFGDPFGDQNKTAQRT